MKFCKRFYQKTPKKQPPPISYWSIQLFQSYRSQSFDLQIICAAHLSNIIYFSNSSLLQGIWQSLETVISSETIRENFAFITCDYIERVLPYDPYMEFIPMNPTVHQRGVIIWPNHTGYVTKYAFFLIPRCTNLNLESYYCCE